MTDIDLDNFKKKRDEAEVFYKSIGSFECPALRAQIHFTSKGFNHLRYSGPSNERKKSVQLKKFQQLKRAVDILKKTTTVQEYRRSLMPVGSKRKSGLRKTSIVEWFAFFAITDFSQQYRVKVIVRRVGGEDGNFHFWSVIPHWTLSNGVRYIGSKSILHD